MYSHEIERLLKIKNYIINNEDYLNILLSSPQINFIEYNGYDDKIHIKTDDRYDFKTKVKRIDEK